MKDLLKYKDFWGSVHYSTEDEVFHGKLVGIVDLVTFEGSTVKELKKAFKEAVDDYLDICTSLNKSPHKSYKGTFNVRVNPNTHKKAAYKSMQLGLSLNQFVEQAIKEKLSDGRADNV